LSPACLSGEAVCPLPPLVGDLSLVQQSAAITDIPAAFLGPSQESPYQFSIYKYPVQLIRDRQRVRGS
jgi:hypothetical protein